MRPPVEGDHAKHRGWHHRCRSGESIGVGRGPNAPSNQTREATPMKTRPFGKTGFASSEMGLGCWQLGGTDWGAVDDRAALAILAAAVDAGVNFLDTADVYGDGRSEELIGRFLKGRGERIYVATKLGR